MLFIRRDRGESNRFTGWQLGLFFLAAGLWLGGVMADNRMATGAAIAVLVLAVLLGMHGRRARE